MVGPVLQALVSRLASGGDAPQEDGDEAHIATHHHSLEDALASMPTPDIQCIELDSSMCFEQNMLDGRENNNFEPLDDFQLPPPVLGLDTDGGAGLCLTVDGDGSGAVVTSELRAPRAAATLREEVTRFWSLNLPLVADSVEASSQAPTDEDLEEEKASAGQELCESSRTASHADEELSAAALRHSQPSCARKPAAPLPTPYGCTVRVGRRRVAVRRARQVGMATKRDVGCGASSHASRSRRRRQPPGNSRAIPEPRSHCPMWLGAKSYRAAC
jgi:hypothetical protein